MKIKICAIACFMGMAVTITSCTTKNMEKDYAAYVNPFIGTGGHGHTFPGPVVPNGMIQPSPDTRIDGRNTHFDHDLLVLLGFEAQQDFAARL